MDPLGTTQPLPGPQALGLFAQATLGLFDDADDDALPAFAARLALLTDVDLLLMYADEGRPGALGLLADWGLPPDVRQHFAQIDQGAQPHDTQVAEPGAYAPPTSALQQQGIRACWTCPMWSRGLLGGQLLFCSRRWEFFHRDTLAVFAAATASVAHALQRRKAASVASQPSWKDAGDGTAANKQRQFIAVLAHELRNPIAPIRSGLDLLSADLLDQEGRRSTLDMMQRQVVHLVRLVDDLLDTVRLDTGRLLVKREPALLCDVVRSAIESIRPALAAKRLALRLDDAAAHVVVDVDPVRLSQAFVNILSANVRQTASGGVIAVEVIASATELTVTFEDEGDGVATGDINNVFELFPGSAEQKSEEGWGIGLALVKGLVELNDGHVELRNRDAGNGSIYTVTLPRTDIDPATLSSAATATATAAGASPAPAWPSHRVLIVDDNRDAADTLGLLFELDGHTARAAYDGPTAVSEAQEFQPEIVLMDIGLPGFDGNEATRQIRAQQTQVRPFIIALTGWGADEDKEATRLAGFDMHIVKPVSHDALRQTILELTGTPAKGRGQGHGHG